MSVCMAATSLLISSFLTRHLVGLIIFHGIMFGTSCGLGYIVSSRTHRAWLMLSECIHYTQPVLFEEAWSLDWNSVLRRWFRRSGHVLSELYSLQHALVANCCKISQAMIAKCGLSWTFRVLALISLLLGIVSTLIPLEIISDR